MRIVFMGTPDFAVPSLHRLIKEGYQVVGVVTQPDRPKGRKQILTPPPVKELALQYGIPVHQPEKIRRPEELTIVKEWAPDLIVTAAFGQILPKALLEMPKLGCINVHASLLPKYRGGAPIHYAVINGEKESGVTIMYMVEALDAGDIISQAAIPVDERDTVGTLYEKLRMLGADLLARTLPDIMAGKVKAIPQDPAQVTYAPNIKREDEQLNFSRSAQELYNQVRGLNPWPVAFTTLHGQVLKVWWTEWSSQDAKSLPGTIEAITEDGIEVATAKGRLILKEVQPAGKRRMSVADYLRGSSIEVGMRFESIYE
jgi:methionyl-tRNA formyltransferase